MISKELDKIFKETSYESETLLYEIIKRGYVYSKVERDKKILFVGINPSYISGSKPYDHTIYNVQDVVKLYPKHYKKFQNIAENCNVGNNWTYTDIFYFRETNQNTIDSFLNDDVSLTFLVKQLEITITQLETLNPDLIIVCNSGARKFFGIDKQTTNNKDFTDVWMGFDFAFDERFGVDVITGLNQSSIKADNKTTSLVGTPVLFSSTLTYMDSSTKKRLEWQIKTILKFKKLFVQLKVLAKKLEQNKNLKSILVSENKFEETAKLRDIEFSDLEELVALLLQIEK